MTSKKQDHSRTETVLSENVRPPDRRRGRPKGTQKPAEEKRHDTHIRFSPEVQEMIQKGLEQTAGSPLSTKTDFIEQAIKHYSRDVLQQSPPAPEQDLRIRQEMPPELSHEQAEGDYFGRWLEDWTRERPDLDLIPFAIFGNILRTAQIIDTIMAQMTAPYGIKHREFALLAALRRANPEHELTPTALYQALLFTPGAITKQVDRLLALGLVERKSVFNDRRSILVSLTARGFDLVESVMRGPYTSAFPLLSDLLPQEQAQLALLLQKMLHHLEQHLSAQE